MWSVDEVSRPFWLQRLDQAWEKVPIVWLTGVRRVGKTTLARQLPKAYFLNCDLPSVARRLEDPERFFGTVQETTVLLDEIHQLPDPSRVLKIAADEWRHLRILATGSSTLAATQRFRDTLTGRKRTVHLLPVLHRELAAFGSPSIEHRLLRGGLPEPLLAGAGDPGFYAEWLDSYFSRDIQELFRVGKRREFLKLVQLILRQSGGLWEATSLARLAGLSRPTVMSYLEILEVTHVLRLLRPFHGGGRREILHQPKVYGFDTGFVAYANGWNELRDPELGLLWEHLVLETLAAERELGQIYYWRDKDKREVDFVLPESRGNVTAIECKWNPDAFSPRALQAFRASHSEGASFVLSPRAGAPYLRLFGDLSVVFSNLEYWDSGEAVRLAATVKR